MCRFVRPLLRSVHAQGVRAAWTLRPPCEPVGAKPWSRKPSSPPCSASSLARWSPTSRSRGSWTTWVERIVDVLPVTAAGVTLIAPGLAPRYVAASNPSALRFEQLQTEVGQGPCLLAYESGEAVSVPDMRDESRFPLFAPPAIAAGMAAVFTFPLHHGEGRLGALDLYRDTPGALDSRDLAAAHRVIDLRDAHETSDRGDRSGGTRARCPGHAGAALTGGTAHRTGRRVRRGGARERTGREQPRPSGCAATRSVAAAAAPAAAAATPTAPARVGGAAAAPTTRARTAVRLRAHASRLQCGEDE